MSQRTVIVMSFALFLALFFWGGFGLIVYLGLPIHQLVFMTPSEVQDWNLVCDAQMQSSTQYAIAFCRGAATIFPYLGKTLGMASPFLGYALVSAAFFFGFLVYRGFQTGSFRTVVSVNPLKIIVAFVASVWLFGTMFSLGSLYNANTPDELRIVNEHGIRTLQPLRRFFEPTERVYSGAGPEALEALKANYQSLLSRGCLRETGVTTQGGARIYDLKLRCMQMSLLSRAGTQILLIGLLLLNVLVLGRFLIVSVIGLRTIPLLPLTVLSAGTGALGLTAALWLLTVASQLHPPLVRLLFFGLPLLLHRQTLWWLQRSRDARSEVECSWKSWHFYLGWLLVSYLALNFLNVVRPFPIGWDDLGSYLNRPRLLSSYGSFIPSMSQFQWEYLTSLGFLLFGYDSITGSTMAMQINWSAGLLAVLAVYALGRTFFGQGGGLVSAIMYYFLPMTGHFSYADMKIDNASFFTTVLGVLAVLLYCFPQEEEKEKSHGRQILLVAGLLAAFSFAIKPTAILGILMMLTILAGASLRGTAAPGMAIIGLAILQQFGALNIVDVSVRANVGLALSQTGFTVLTFFLGALLVAFAGWRNRDAIVPVLKSVIVFALGMGIACVPWMTWNVYYSGHWSVATMLAAEDKTAPLVFYNQKEEVEAMGLPPTQSVRYLPPELVLDPKNPACTTSARREELDRYWGFSNGLSHYLTLPWRQVMNIDTFGYYVTFAPVLLLFLLLLMNPMLYDAGRTKWLIGASTGVLALILHALLILTGVEWYASLLSWLYAFTVLRVIGYLLIVVFLLLPWVALLWRKEVRWLGLLFTGTWMFLIEWALVGNGIAWYGIGMFLGLAIGMEALIRYAPDKATRSLSSFLVGASILICLTNRFWQFDTQKNLFEYPLGKATAEALREATIPEYDDIRESVVRRHETMPKTPYTYRIGTFISYFIPRNREIFPLADHQLNMFSCMNQEENHVMTLQRLQALGFNGIIFDTNTETIERDPNGSLHRKVRKFHEFANDPALGLEIVVDDPGNGIAYILLPPPASREEITAP